MATTLAAAQDDALTRIETERETRSIQVVTVPVVGGTAEIRITERSLVRWLSLYVMRDLHTVRGDYPLTIPTTTGVAQLADAAGVAAVVEALYLAGLAVEQEASAAEAAVLGASKEDDVAIALAEYKSPRGR